MVPLERQVAGIVEAAFTDVDVLSTLAGVRPAHPQWTVLLTKSVERQTIRLAIQLATHLIGTCDESADEPDVGELPATFWAANARLLHSRQRLARALAPEDVMRQAVSDFANRDASSGLRAWLDRFDVKVEVVGVTTCTACDGKGVVGFGNGDRFAGSVGDVCSACSRYKVVPVLRVTVGLAGIPRFAAA